MAGMPMAKAQTPTNTLLEPMASKGAKTAGMADVSTRTPHLIDVGAAAAGSST